MLNLKNIYDIKSIKTILKKNYIYDDIEFINYLNLNKLIVYFKSKEYILKIFYDNFSTKLGKNEHKGYKFINSSYKKFSLPKYECILNDDNLFISKIKYLGENKGNYFDSRNYFSLNYASIISSIDAKLYGEKLLDKFSNFIDISDLNKTKIYIEKFLNTNGNLKLYLDSSHGDFAHWNTRFINNTYYCFDLEHFSNERIFLYDLIHWYFIPLIQKRYFFKIKLISKYSLELLIIYLKKTFSKKYKVNNLESFNFLIFFYLIEKKLYYLNMISDEKQIKSMTKGYLNQAIFLNNEISKLLNILISK